MNAPDFSYDGFRAILQEIQSHRYRFARLDDASDDPDEKRVYLRHDVDMSPRCALRLGSIAAELGVCSTFLFQLNAETYNVFAPANLRIMDALRTQGHCVGLHIDENLVGVNSDKILLTLRWFSECCTPIDHAVSFHRPTPACLGRDFEGFTSGYAPRVFGEDRYLSDSRRTWDFRERLTAWLTEARTPIQLLLHPEWWHPHETADEIWEDLKRRRANDLARYMVANFRRVFASAVGPVDEESFGL